MNIRKYILLFFLPLFFFFNGCKKDSGFSDVPEISLISVSPTNATELQDTIVLSVFYKDGNGDLGENDADVKNVFVKDARLSNQYEFRIPELSPPGSAIAIQGTLEVKVPPTGITNGSNSQTTTFTVWVKDRAGNESNHETSNTVTITP